MGLKNTISVDLSGRAREARIIERVIADFKEQGFDEVADHIEKKVRNFEAGVVLSKLSVVDVRRDALLKLLEEEGIFKSGAGKMH